MGRMTYGPYSFSLDDRTLRHLQVVLSAKLRRHETVLFTWHRSLEEGSGRLTVLITPWVPLAFSYDGSKSPTVNPAWIEDLTAVANSSEGLRLLPEPPPQPHRD